MLPSLNQGKLEKMVIWAYDVDSSTNSPVQLSQDEEKKYQLLVNPGSFTLDQMVLRDTRQGHGTSGTQPRYLGNAPATFDLKVLFDNTGVIPKPPEGPLSGIPIVGAIADALSGGGEEQTVMSEIDKFNKVVLDYESEAHEPNTVAICWGPFIIDFLSLTSISYEFKLFAPDGTPLRAFANASFVESRPDAERENEEPSFSPDVTKVHTVKAGDTLPLLAEKFYEDQKLYIEIARVNGLVNFRNLIPGTRLIIPSVDNSLK